MIGTLMRLFPNLEVLTFQDISVDKDWLVDDHDSVRALDPAEQDDDYGPFMRWHDRVAASLHPGPRDAPAWPRLRTLRTFESSELFLVPLPGPVERLEATPKEGFTTYEVAAHMYAHLRPRVVFFPLGREHMRSETEFAHAVKLHLGPLEHAPSVTHLTVALSSDFIVAPHLRNFFHVGFPLPIAQVLPLDEMLSVLSEALSRSSVSHFLLELPALRGLVNAFGVTEFYRDTSEGMQVLSDGIPSLRKIFFDFEGQGMKAWEQSVDGNGKWREMNEWEALKIVFVEGMRRWGSN